MFNPWLETFRIPCSVALKKKSLPVGEELMMKDDERSVEFH